MEQPLLREAADMTDPDLSYVSAADRVQEIDLTDITAVDTLRLPPPPPPPPPSGSGPAAKARATT